MDSLDNEEGNISEDLTGPRPTSDFELIQELVNVKVAAPDERAKTSRFYTPNSNIPDFCPIVINLNLPRGSFIRRRTSQRVDPINNTIYSGSQIRVSTAVTEEAINLSESLEDDDEAADEEDANEEEENEEEEDQQDTIPKEKYENPMDVINYDEKDVKDMEKARKKKLPKRVKLANKTIVDKVPEEVLPRLLTRPEDILENVEKEDAYWTETVDPFISGLEAKSRQQVKDQLYVINVDATQHPDVVFEDVISRIESIGKGKSIKVVAPKILPAVSPGTKGTLNDLIF